MHLRNRTDEVIASIPKGKLPSLKKFLKTLKVSAEGGEMVDCILNHPKCRWEGPHAMEVFDIDTDEDESVVVVFGKTQIHLFIKKNKQGQKLVDRLLAFIPFPKFKPSKEFLKKQKK